MIQMTACCCSSNFVCLFKLLYGSSSSMYGSKCHVGVRFLCGSKSRVTGNRFVKCNLPEQQLSVCVVGGCVGNEPIFRVLFPGGATLGTMSNGNVLQAGWAQC